MPKRSRIRSAKPRRAYMDMTNFDYELGYAPATMVYATINDTIKDNRCIDECGIVEVEIRLKRIVRRSKLGRDEAKKASEDPLAEATRIAQEIGAYEEDWENPLVKK